MRGGWSLLAIGALAAVPAATDVELMTSLASLPAHVAGAFTEIGACHMTAAGEYLIFDRRAHAVALAAPNADAPRVIVQIGVEPGRLLQPSAFDVAPNGTFAVADAPNGQPRIQFFTETGSARGGFRLPRPQSPQFTMDSVVVSGIGSLKYTGESIFLSQPESGALVTEYTIAGQPARTFGDLRRTGQERDRDVHLAMNVGLVVAIPTGGFYFVFRSGVPMFRRYDRAGALMFERHIEGVELDSHIRGLPTTWAPRRPSSDEFPLVLPTVRTAAADAEGNLWVSLITPYTYVYDGRGDKRRTVQFRAAGIIAPTAFAFVRSGRVLVTPGCYEFDRSSPAARPASRPARDRD
jgi:hypothetical protein